MPRPKVERGPTLRRVILFVFFKLPLLLVCPISLLSETYNAPFVPHGLPFPFHLKHLRELVELSIKPFYFFRVCFTQELQPLQVYLYAIALYFMQSFLSREYKIFP
ncbi:hypothetical protein D3C73_811850 [compost metagenome]